MLQAFCVVCGVHARDLGVGTFRTKSNPVMADAVQGICKGIYGSVDGPLEITVLANRYTPQGLMSGVCAASGQRRFYRYTSRR